MKEQATAAPLVPGEFLAVALRLIVEDRFDASEVVTLLLDQMTEWDAMPGTIAEWRRVVGAITILANPSPECLRVVASRIVDTGATMGFGMVTQWAAQSKAPSAHRAVGAMIAGHVNDEGPRDALAWPSIKRLSELTGKSPSNVRASIAALVAAGELTVESRRAPNGHGNCYRLRWNDTNAESSPTGVQPHDDERLSACAPPPADRRSREPAHRLEKEGKGKKGTGAAGKPGGDGKPRKRDELFDALANVCGIVPADLTSSARGAMNRALQELRAVEATAEEIARRAEQYRHMWPRVALTPSALARHWHELAAPYAGRFDEGVVYR